MNLEKIDKEINEIKLIIKESNFPVSNEIFVVCTLQILKLELQTLNRLDEEKQDGN
jgi:hypothetical protein